MPSNDKSEQWLGSWAQEGLGWVAQRASNRTAYLASAFDEFSRLRGMSPEKLADFLGCAPQSLAKLALCRRPDPSSSEFTGQTDQIASHCGANPRRLRALLEELNHAQLPEIPMRGSGMLSERSDIGSGQMDFAIPSEFLEATAAEPARLCYRGGVGTKGQTGKTAETDLGQEILSILEATEMGLDNWHNQLAASLAADHSISLDQLREVQEQLKKLIQQVERSLQTIKSLISVR